MNKIAVQSDYYNHETYTLLGIILYLDKQNPFFHPIVVLLLILSSHVKHVGVNLRITGL